MTKIDKSVLIFGITIFLKFILFDVLWCIPTTFAPFSSIEFYTTKLIATLILLIPYAFFKLWKTETIIMFLLDALLIANLMYFRTYYTAIPLNSYGLSGNLADFTGSVVDSLRWYDLFFPLSTIAAVLIHLRTKKTPHLKRPAPVLPYLGVLAAIICIFTIVTMTKGGFKAANAKVRQAAYLCSSGASMYTVFGSLCYDLMNQQAELTPEVQKEIEDWLAQKPKHEIAVPDSCSGSQRNNCIIIFAESLESWVLEKEVEGQEITPYLNKLLKDSTTLYAPHVLTQVKGGRSIDAQLMLCTGLLPLNSGTYSSQYPNHVYPSLQKAMREKKQSRNYLLTIDKVSTWNQGPIAYSFGIDTILAYHDFKLTEAFGTHKRTGDGSFFAQCQEKISKGEIWKKGENAYIQFITYSGHAPFILPEHLREVSFSADIPEKMGSYMTTARYTDKAIGKFVEYLKTLPQYKETLIVITGDHEGLASYRTELCDNPYGKGIVSDKPFTPFIVVNSPVGMRYDEVMGQIDMYPTLLNLLQLDDYYWTGLGESILNPDKKGFAVGSQMNVEGEGYTPEEVDFAKEAYEVSDQIIHFNYFGRK
ncbi:LTA synthase family protein [Bacteroides oleiciplenus]|uniref:Sulfatase N-terminal domain-containing protein n=1 Tax=Bacteroides oleiciplenus YIT 12058 TaxID=742727 RepID=K9EID4_9BACE|nr:LTA synthase family protein [Bacteroides oleiciplenus]EKU90737.1 hypothetical protein HMPREF9447_02155 [Bacteroides oleiciplenus YIT 12058]